MFYFCFVQDDIGCLSGKDPEGVNYTGPGARDGMGIDCIPWNTAGLGKLYTGPGARNRVGLYIYIYICILHKSMKQFVYK